MTVIDLLTWLGELGARYHRADLPIIHRYFSAMIAAGRLMLVQERGEIQALVCYAICQPQESERFHQKPLWLYVRHDPHARCLYIEKLFAKRWTRGMRQELTEHVLTKYPQLRWLKAHRADPDRDRPYCIPLRRIRCRPLTV